MRHGWSDRLETFTQSFGSDQLDASALRLVQLGFLPLKDRRLRSTIDAVDNGLSSGPLVYRYHAANTDDGLSDPEGSFIICAYWLADALALVGDLEQAERRFERLLAFNTPLGLIAEEVDPNTGALLGNFPQAFSHLADGLSDPEGSFIICAYWLADALALVGDLEQAERRFERLLAFNTPLGLIAEEVDPNTGALLGNFPQAFSHLALISAAINIERRRGNTIVRNRDADGESFTTTKTPQAATGRRAGP